MTIAASSATSSTPVDPRDQLRFFPAELSSPRTTVTQIPVGMSGAQVYLVDDGDTKSVLKITPGADTAEWTRSTAVSVAAAEAGVAPQVRQVSQEGRALLIEFVADRSFPALYGNPETRTRAIDLLGQLISRVHAITPPPGVEPVDPIAVLRTLWAQFGAATGTTNPAGSIPAIVRDSVTRLLTEEAPASDRQPVLCHNDLNPTNLVFDGERLLMLDWQTAAINDPYYDLATISVFLRMDESAVTHLLRAYDSSFSGELTARFGYFRRLAATLSGCVFLMLSRSAGIGVGDDAVASESISSLGEVYAELRSGATSLSSPETQRRMGLALISEGQEH